MKRAFLIAALLFCFGAHTADLSRIPAGYEWTARIDLRAGRESAMIGRVLDSLFPRNRESLASRVRLFKLYTGIDLSKDLDEVLFFGNRNLDTPDLVYAAGRFDRRAVAQSLTSLRTRKEVYRKTDVHTLRMEDGSVYFLAQPSSDVFLAATRKDSLLRAIDCHAGVRRGLSPNAPSARALVRAKSRVAAMYTGNPQQFAVNAILAAGLSLANSAELTFDAQERDRADLQAVLRTDSPQSAQGMYQAVSAAKAFFLYRKDPPELAALASLATVSVHGNEVRVRIPLTAKTAARLCKQMEIDRIGEVSAQDLRKAEAFLKRKGETPPPPRTGSKKNAQPRRVR